MVRILPGDRFGRLCIVSRSQRACYFSVVCDCGRKKEIHRTSLLSGRTKSCGCFHREVMIAGNARRTRKRLNSLKVKDLLDEEWRIIPGFERHYVSNKGRIKVVFKYRERLLLTKKTTGLFEGHHIKYVGRIAVLVLRAFVGEAPADKPLARHLDDNVENNDLVNLAWGSYSDNMRDAVRNGKHDYRKTEEYRKKLGLAISAAKRRVA